MIPILCNCLQSSPTSTYRVVFVFLWTHSQSVSRLCFCVLSFKDNFEVNNEIKDVTKTFEAPEHILLISLWGLRRPHVFLFLLLWVLSCRKHLNALSFLTAGCSWGPRQRFLLRGPSLQPPCSLQGTFRSLRPSPFPSGHCPHPHAFPTVSTAKCDALIFFSSVFVLFLCFCFGFFLFLLRLCPEKTSFACFLLFLHTFVYITFTSLFSIVCAKTDRFKRVSKKLF